LAPSFIQIERLDPTGKLTGSSKWAITTPLFDKQLDTMLVGAELRNKSEVVVVTRTGVRLGVGTVTKTNEVAPLIEFDSWEDPFKDNTESDERAATSFALGPKGEILLAGTFGSNIVRIGGIWFGILESLTTSAQKTTCCLNAIVHPDRPVGSSTPVTSGTTPSTVP
jgi:hypothetical protein